MENYDFFLLLSIISHLDLKKNVFDSFQFLFDGCCSYATKQKYLLSTDLQLVIYLFLQYNNHCVLHRINNLYATFMTSTSPCSSIQRYYLFSN